MNRYDLADFLLTLHLSQEEVEHAQQLANQHETEAADAAKHIKKLEKRILKLQDQLEAERENAKASKQVRMATIYLFSDSKY